MTAKVENYCAQNLRGTQSISVDKGVKACINCIWYEQYYHKNRGNVVGWVPACSGYCLLRERQRGALRYPCKDYETEKRSPVRW